LLELLYLYLVSDMKFDYIGAVFGMPIYLGVIGHSFDYVERRQRVVEEFQDKFCLVSTAKPCYVETHAKEVAELKEQLKAKEKEIDILNTLIDNYVAEHVGR